MQLQAGKHTAAMLRTSSKFLPRTSSKCLPKVQALVRVFQHSQACGLPVQSM